MNSNPAIKTKSPYPLQDRRVLVMASGSIAAVKTPILVSTLVKAGAEVRCIVTPSAARLVSPLSLATLSRNRCYQDEDQWSPNEPKPLHIALSEWAEIVVVAPLSASTLARWTNGLGEGLLASVLLACERPVIAAAAMNTGMWANQAVQKNWQKLQSDPRVLILPPSNGLLACDRIGDGRMVEQGLIQLAITSSLISQDSHGHLNQDWQGLRLLVTAGPTVEALDPARLITNRSSGGMGVLLAQAARFRGAAVDLIHGPLQIPKAWLEGLITHPVSSTEEMQTSLTALQPSADVIAMAAAVADIKKKDGKEIKKISKKNLLDSFGKDFEAAPDLLAELNKKRSKGQILLGFAALTGDDKEIRSLGEEKRLQKGCDLLMANPIDRYGQGFEESFNGGWLLGPNKMVITLPVTSKLALAHQLLNEILSIQANMSNPINSVDIN